MESLKERAQIAGEIKQIISFQVGDEEYGLELLNVKEVIRMRNITWLPKAPPYVKGIISLRGTIIPIIDLRSKFGLAEAKRTEATRVIVVEILGNLLGMVVDSASQVIRIPFSQIDPPPPILGARSREYITGVGRIDDRLVVLMDPHKVLSAEEVSEVATRAKELAHTIETEGGDK